MELQGKLQKLRKERGLSQEKLAELIGVSRQAVSKWESGQSYPELDKMIALSTLFDVSMDHLVKDTPSSPNVEEITPRFHQTDLKFMYHYEYKSKRTCYGLPLLHINIGRGVYIAKGIVAIGNIAIGALSMGVIALGGICLGALGLGLITLAGLALGLLAAIGGLAVGTIAIGGLAVGIFAIGGLSVGVFSLGGGAIASHIAIGGYASGHIAIGDSVRGAHTLAVQNHDFSSIKAEQVEDLITQEYPRLWRFITDRIISIFK